MKLLHFFIQPLVWCEEQINPVKTNNQPTGLRQLQLTPLTQPDNLLLYDSVVILGPQTVTEGSSVSYIGKAPYTLGQIFYFSNTAWTVTNPPGSGTHFPFGITSNGVFTAGDVATTTVVTLTAPFTDDGYPFSVTTNVTILRALPKFAGANFLPNGGLVLTLSNFPGASTVIEGATNLSPSTRAPLVTNSAGTNWVLTWTNFSRTNFTRQFYRARNVP
jgi:hypothetical protein